MYTDATIQASQARQLRLLHIRRSDSAPLLYPFQYICSWTAPVLYKPHN